ncbi:MAG: UPF0175 family protein [Lewinellaceae bacterium]|nr:UPF0175 family protein [Lewinellaceae bacterium]
MNEEELLLTQAVALYAAEKISFGETPGLAGLDWYRFREVLAEQENSGVFRCQFYSPQKHRELHSVPLW